MKRNQQKVKRIMTNAKIKKTREDFNKLRNRFLKQKVKEIRINLYEIMTKINLSNSKKKKNMEKNIFELEGIFSKIKKIMIVTTLNTKE